MTEARWPCSCCNYTVCRGAWHAGRTGSGPLSKLAGFVLACVRDVAGDFVCELR